MATLQMYMDKSRIENTFESSVYQEVWGESFGVDNSVGKIKKILVHCPGEELLQLEGGRYEEEADARILTDEKGRIRNYFNLTFTRDIALLTSKGVILNRFAMYFHQGETKLAQKFFTSQGIPIIGAIQGSGTMEGGSFSMLDRHTAIVGRSVRVNDEGIEQLRRLLSYQDIELIVLDMPAYYIHLDEAFVPVDKNKVLCSTFILPFWFLKMLKEKGYEIIEADRDDPMLTNNCLAIAPGKVLFPEIGVRTRKNLEKAGVEVLPVDVSEINKLGGGIHCATLPLWRESI